MTKKYHYTKKTGRPAKYKSVEEMSKKIDEYFEITDKMPTKAGLTLHLGFVDKVSLIDYAKRPKFSILIKTAFMRLETLWEQKLAENGCTGSIFWLKNNAGYQDKQTIVSEGEQKTVNPEEEKTYADAARAANLKLSKRSG